MEKRDGKKMDFRRQKHTNDVKTEKKPSKHHRKLPIRFVLILVIILNSP